MTVVFKLQSTLALIGVLVKNVHLQALPSDSQGLEWNAGIIDLSARNTDLNHFTFGEVLCLIHGLAPS